VNWDGLRAFGWGLREIREGLRTLRWRLREIREFKEFREGLRAWMGAKGD
jgi:hypothetical protein